MNVTDSSAGRLIDRLERDGLIERNRNESDRRVIYIKLTKNGDDLITELLPYGEIFNNDLTNDISEEELKIFDKVLKKMQSNVCE